MLRLDNLSDTVNDSMREVGKLLHERNLLERFDKNVNKLRKGASLDEKELKYCTADDFVH